jgi:hypothetical protein
VARLRCVDRQPQERRLIEVEGELRHREFQPKGSDINLRAAEIHVSSILTLDRSEKAELEETAATGGSGDDDTPF